MRISCGKEKLQHCLDYQHNDDCHHGGGDEFFTLFHRQGSAQVAAQHIGSGAGKWFAFTQAAAVVFGAVMPTSSLWSAAEAVNGLMAIPNLFALTVLLPQIRRLTIEYQEKAGI